MNVGFFFLAVQSRPCALERLLLYGLLVSCVNLLEKFCAARQLAHI
jgi:hypothetical protein